ncbi:MAG: LytTR family transcriptional regulator DNA-binding domain-containing protein [Lachnospiraceae bacterium]|jgi:DNA-binding LytR/AlgR family response regulator|nr:LytTR family transcriptional regulator DNA-binding domain-containing protein [Lachnospiraceae bacterium]
MKVEIRQAKTTEEESAIITAVKMTDSIKSAVDILRDNAAGIAVSSGNDTLMIRTDLIYYIESVDKRTYVYTKGDCFETKYRLYELEDILGFNFLRCSKAMIVNIRKIRSVRAELNARMSVELLNGERIIISRGYVKDLKNKLGV